MAWGTVARFKEAEITPAEIGRTLGVRLVLTRQNAAIERALDRCAPS